MSQLKPQSVTASTVFRALRAALGLGVVSAALTLFPALASAAQTHAFSATTIGSPGAGAGQLSLQPFKNFEAAASGVAVSPVSHDLYVADSKNHRIDVFQPNGTFLYAFGWEVNATSPEAKLQICTTASGCQAGQPGTEPGQLGNPTYLAFDEASSSPSYGDLYAAAGVGVEGQRERQRIKVKNATGGTFSLTFEGQTTTPIPYDASRYQLQQALGALSTVGFDNLFVSGSAVEGSAVEFFHALGDTDVPSISANGSGLSGAGAAVEVSTVYNGARFAPEIVTKFDPEGHLIESWGTAGQLTETASLATATGSIASAATGTGDLDGTTQVTNVNTATGTFQAGQGIAGPGIPFNTYITAVGAGTLTLSQSAGPDEGTAANQPLSTNTRFITNVNTTSGTFELFQQISGPGIPPHTRIEGCELVKESSRCDDTTSYLVLSKGGTVGGSGVSLSADFPFSDLSGIAPDPSGDILVPQGSRIARFDQAGTFLGLLTLSGAGAGGGRLGAAVDLAGNLYLAYSASVEEYGPTGNSLHSAYLTPLDGETGFDRLSITAFTRAPSGDLYVDEGTAIQAVSRQCEPSSLGCLPLQEFGAGNLSEGAGLAVAPDGTLYAADVGANRIAVFIVSLEANIEAPTEVKSHSGVLHGTINPEGGEVTTCRFQTGASKTYGHNLPCLNEAGEEVGTVAHPLTGGSAVALHAKLEGLGANALYHYRLRAVNSDAEEIRSDDERLETLVLPRIEALEATEVTATSAVLETKVNPLGAAVSACQIEWGATSEPGNPAVPYEHSLACEPSSLPSGTEAKPISARLEGLTPGTTYHWRVLATNSTNGTEASPDNTFVFLPGPPSAEVSQDCANQALREADASTALPDCRAYEQVSPPQKNGSLLAEFFGGTYFSVAQDGSHVLAPTEQCFPSSDSCGPVRGPVGSTFGFSRGPGGWQAARLGVSATAFAGNSLLVSSPDASDQLFALPVPEPPALEGREWFYVRHVDGSLTPIGPVFPTAAAGGGSIKDYSESTSASADLSHVVFSPGNSELWPFDESTRGSLLEYAGPAQHPFLVAVTGGQGSNELVATCDANLAGAHGSNRSLSADGRVIFFEVGPCAGGTGTNAGVKVPEGSLYARIDGESADARTVKFSGSAPEPQCNAACQTQPVSPALFAGAAADGSAAYFLSTRQLTDDATEDSRRTDQAGSCEATRGSGCNLYLFNDLRQQPLTGNHLTGVSAGDTSGQGPQVQGVMAISQDGQRVYFVAKGLLAGANPEGDEPTEGADNLYLYDATEAETHFIATLPGASEKALTEAGQWITANPTANVTPDGQFLLFTSHGALTPDATRPFGPAQVYRYDAGTESLTRVSIGQKGFNDNGNAGTGNAAIVALNGSISARRSGRPPLDPSLSADGHRVFFESPVGLTPAALDEVPSNNRGDLARNVYEWEQDGAGSCEEASGCLYLISDGVDAAEGPSGEASTVKLIGTDESGENVFFTTADSLVPVDTDSGRDIYDAHALGGFAPPPSPTPCESSDACHGEGSKEGSNPAAATPVFNGPEEGAKHPQKPPKHHKKKHAKKHHKAKKQSAKRAKTDRRASR